MVTRRAFIVFVLGCLTLAQATHASSASLADSFFASQTWNQLQASLTWTLPNVEVSAQQESLFMNSNGDQAFWAWPTDSSATATPARVSIFKGPYYYSYLQGTTTSDGVPLTQKSIRVALLRLIAPGKALKGRAKVLSTLGQTVRLRWEDWNSSPVLELSLDGSGRLVSAHDLSSTVMLQSVQYDLQDGQTYISGFEIASKLAVAGGLTVTGQVVTQRATLSQVQMNVELEGRWFRLP